LENLLSTYSFTNKYNVIHKQYSMTADQPLILPCRNGICGFCFYITDSKGNTIITDNDRQMQIDIYQNNMQFFYTRPLRYYNRQIKYDRLKKARPEKILKLLPLEYYFYMSMALSLYGNNPSLCDKIKVRIEMKPPKSIEEEKYYVNIYEFAFSK